MQTKNSESVYYSPEKVLSYNIPWMMILSERGPGKTFSLKKRCIKSPHIKEFMWVRRKVNNEMDELVSNDAYKWTSDLYENNILSPDDVCQMSKDLFILNGEPKGHFVPLSTSLGKKGNNYSRVTDIIFDEFLIREDGRANRYLKDEVYLLMNLYETVNRSRDSIRGEKPVKLWMLGNKEGIFNPYFAEWKITPFEERFKIFSAGKTEIIVENYHNDLFNSLKKESVGGKSVMGTRSGLSMVENKFWEGELINVRSRPRDSKLKYNIRMGDGIYGIWIHESGIYFSEKHNKILKTFAVKDDIVFGDLILSKRTPLGQMMKVQFEYDRCFFEDSIIKNRFIIMMNQLRNSI